MVTLLYINLNLLLSAVGLSMTSKEHSWPGDAMKDNFGKSKKGSISPWIGLCALFGILYCKLY